MWAEGDILTFEFPLCRLDAACGIDWTIKLLFQRYSSVHTDSREILKFLSCRTSQSCSYISYTSFELSICFSVNEENSGFQLTSLKTAALEFFNSVLEPTCN